MKHLDGIFMKYLSNTAAAVREMGVSKSIELAEAFGSDWVITSYIPKCVESYNADQTGFNYRMCALMSLSVVLPVLKPDQITEKSIPTFVKATSDNIPNVQFCVAKILAKNKKLIDPSVWNSQIVPKLKDMSQEPDKDVAYFGFMALQE